MKMHLGIIAATLCMSGAALAGGFDAEQVSATAPLASFKSVHIAPVALELDLDVSAYGGSGSGDRPVDADDAAEKASDFEDDLRDAFGKSFSLASAPGAGVLTVAATLTELESSRPTMADYRRTIGLAAVSVYAGGAAMSVAFSEAGAPLGEVSDKDDSTLGDGRPRVGQWDDADRAFRGWARQLVEFVREH